MFLASIIGIDKIRYPKRDVANNQIWVCTSCGCHFIGEQCPSNRH